LHWLAADLTTNCLLALLLLLLLCCRLPQRTFVGVDAFKVYQEIFLQPDEPRVCNVVEFGRSIGYLRVSVWSLPARGGG
jgi:hypothetical protein